MNEIYDQYARRIESKLKDIAPSRNWSVVRSAETEYLQLFPDKHRIRLRVTIDGVPHTTESDIDSQTLRWANPSDFDILIKRFVQLTIRNLTDYLLR